MTAPLPPAGSPAPTPHAGHPQAVAALEVALGALQDGRRGDALEAALSAWRALRTPSLSALVEAIGAEAARALPPVAGRTRRAFHEQWLDVANAKRAVDVPRLLDGLRHPPWTRFRERLDRLAQLPDDPRIARALARFVEDLPVLSGIEASGWRQVFRLIERQMDAACAPHLERRRAAVRQTPTFVEEDAINPRTAALCERLAQAGPAELDSPLPAAVAQAVRRLALGPPATGAQLAASTAPRTSEPELLATIYAAPEADAPRLVYADFLLDRGDPRGTFITLQFQSATRPVSKAHLKREARLLKQHLAQWLGPLEPVVVRDTVRFEKGFLAACATSFRTPKQLDELAHHPAWSTLVELGSAGPLLLAGRLPCLRKLTAAISWAEAEALASRPAPLPRLERLWISGGAEADAVRARFARTAALPALRALRLTPEAGDLLRWLVGTPLGARLTHVDLLHHGLTLRGWWPLCAELPALEELSIGASPRFRFLKDAAGWRLELSNIVVPARAWDAVQRLEGAVKRLVLVAPDAAGAVEAQVAKRLGGYDVSIARPLASAPRAAAPRPA